MTTDVKNPGIRVNPAGCWIVVKPGGGDLDDWIEYHSSSEAEALKELAGYATEDVPVAAWTVRQLDVPCTEAYSLCGAQFAYHGDCDEEHFDSPETAAEQMRYTGLVEVAPDLWTCEEKNCEVCQRAVAEAAARLVPELPGQDELPGMGGAR
jgi:hypothetical protein